MDLEVSLLYQKRKASYETAKVDRFGCEKKGNYLLYVNIHMLRTTVENRKVAPKYHQGAASPTAIPMKCG